MSLIINKAHKRKLRHRRIRKKITGTTERPRLAVRRSLNHFYAQVVDDAQRKTLISLSTLSKDVKSKVKAGGNIEAAKSLGSTFAEAAKKKGITKVSFDRGGYLYHGRVKAFAEAAREAGLEF